MTKRFFLAKAGQTYGPFDRNEIETLRESGQYEKYTWFWDQDVARWQAIDPPPAPPSVAAQSPSTSTSQQQHQPQPSQSLSVSQDVLRGISAICHDQQSVLSGVLSNVSDAGCEFLCDSHSASPELQTKISIFLHLFETSSRRSIKVTGRVGRIDRRNGQWVYRIHWKKIPQLFQRSSGARLENSIG